LVALDLAYGFDAGGAESLGDCAATFKYLHFLHVHLPLATGCLLGPGAVVPKLGAFAALLTLCHDVTPLQISRCFALEFPARFHLINLSRIPCSPANVKKMAGSRRRQFVQMIFSPTGMASGIV
jgi:hypothetical protein